MEVPIEEMPQPARGRIESLMGTMARRCALEGKMRAIGLLEKFYAGLGVTEKQVGDGEIEEWVYEYLERGDGWVEDATLDLFEEAVATHEEAVRAQLCSSIGKDLPEAYELSVTERNEAWNASLESAQSVADTYNRKLRGWIEDAKAEWWEDHDESYVGLNRFTLLGLVRDKVEDYDAWKIPQIAVTEFAREWTVVVGAFWLVNKGSAEIECLMMPGTSSDPGRDTPVICATFAGQWFPYEEAVSLSHQHPNCPHHPGKSRVKSGFLPLFFVIGGVRYAGEDLPSC